MTQLQISCKSCGKSIRMEVDLNNMPRFCPFCANAFNNEMQETPAQQTSESTAPSPAPQKQPSPAPTPPKQPSDKKQMKNVVFCNKNKYPCCVGDIPEGYSPSGRLENFPDNADTPILVWASANDNTGRQMFCRYAKNHFYPKAAMPPNTRFMPFDEYLDNYAIQLLGKNQLRLCKRYPLSAKEEQSIRNALDQDSQLVKSKSRGDMLQIVIQGLYGGGGAKLYSAVRNGKTQYLLLYALIYGMEQGSYSPMTRAMYAKNMQNLQQMQMMTGRSFVLPPDPAMQNAMAPIDVNPSVPFGQHSTAGLNEAVLFWRIAPFGGFLSPEMPTETEYKQFLHFVHSISIHRLVQNQINEFQRSYMQRTIQDQNTAFQIGQQMIRDRQKSWDRQQGIMRDLNDHRDRISAEMRESANADFDHRSRLQHESMMGVNTFGRTDGSTVEYSVNADRVFQHNNDPDLTVGVSGTVDPPPMDWTELEKLK